MSAPDAENPAKSRPPVRMTRQLVSDVETMLNDLESAASLFEYGAHVHSAIVVKVPAEDHDDAVVYFEYDEHRSKWTALVQ